MVWPAGKRRGHPDTSSVFCKKQVFGLRFACRLFGVGLATGFEVEKRIRKNSASFAVRSLRQCRGCRFVKIIGLFPLLPENVFFQALPVAPPDEMGYINRMQVFRQRESKVFGRMGIDRLSAGGVFSILFG